MNHRFLRVALILGILVLLVTTLTPIQSFAQSLHASDPALIAKTSGMIDADGTILYSIFLATGPAALEKLAVSFTVPGTPASVDSVLAPTDAKFAYVTDPTRAAVWRLDKVEANTIIGPFTYRVKATDLKTPLAYAPDATVTWGGPEAGSLTVPADTSVLQALAEVGTITVDSRGTLNSKGENDAIPVGATGILAFVPAGAVSQSVQMTFTQVQVTDNNVPADTPDYWWCAHLDISTEPKVAFAKPISFGIPTRSPLTPGLPVQGFVSADDGPWTIVSLLNKSAHLARPTNQGIQQPIGFIASNGIMVIAVN